MATLLKNYYKFSVIQISLSAIFLMRYSHLSFGILLANESNPVKLRLMIKFFGTEHYLNKYR